MNIVLKLYQAAFAIISLLLLAIIYLVNHNIELGTLTGLHLDVDMPPIVSYTLYIVGALFVSWLCTFVFPWLQTISLSKANVKNIESADATFVPMYFAYIFVGVSINSFTSLVFCYLIISIICLCAQTYYFNPLLYLLGYKYYFITNSTDKKILIMTKKRIYLGQTLDFERLKKMNDYTYLDIEK